ncbi:uncharacterized protein LOC135099539 isoform X2 [Scylla paramamosain]|uniref:uncharacterized protein LOC135099539 isoform X2 n=1 Tax=Scylla paramamosain TaxID=85552 RepID=UPI003083A53E
MCPRPSPSLQSHVSLQVKVRSNATGRNVKNEEIYEDCLMGSGPPCTPPTSKRLRKYKFLRLCKLMPSRSRSIGRPGVDVHLRHEGDAAVVALSFLINDGALVSATGDDTLHMWSLRQKTPQILHSLKFQRERSRKTHPGTVVHLSENPVDPGKLLIGYESGQLVLWDFKACCADVRYQATEPLRSVSWHHEGKQFMCCHTDGSLTTWTLKQASARPTSTVFPHGDLISKLVQEKEADRDLEQLGKISSVLKRTVAVISRVGTSVCETHTSSGKVADERLKHSEKVEQQQETENCIHHSLPEGIDALLTLDNDVPHEENMNPTELAHRKTKSVTAATTTTATASTDTKSPTVQRILDLRNEMESTSQLEHFSLQKFHPCPLCLGKLITV